MTCITQAHQSAGPPDPRLLAILRDIQRHLRALGMGRSLSARRLVVYTDRLTAGDGSAITDVAETVDTLYHALRTVPRLEELLDNAHELAFMEDHEPHAAHPQEGAA